jgi:hypothetical protein
LQYLSLFSPQTREQRHRAREIERERALRMKLRAREERARRLALRQRRQEMGSGWMPPEGDGGGEGGDEQNGVYHDELDEL